MECGNTTEDWISWFHLHFERVRVCICVRPCGTVCTQKAKAQKICNQIERRDERIDNAHTTDREEIFISEAIYGMKSASNNSSNEEKRRRGTKKEEEKTNREKEWLVLP